MNQTEQVVAFDTFVSNLAAMFDLVTHDGAIVIERNGAQYRLTRQLSEIHQPTSTPVDPSCVAQVLRDVAGAFAGVDLEALKRDLREQRGHENLSRPA